MSLRIIGGAARGRRIPSPAAGGVRPTGARVREALFGIWGARVEGARVLDLCAGTGAISLEALSRGAARAVAVERDARLCAAMRRNAQALGLAEGLEVRRAHAPSEIARIIRKEEEAFDLAFADPPWADGALRAALIEAVFGAAPVCPHLVVEVPRSAVACAASGAARLVRERRYGDTRLLFYEVRAAGADEGGGEDILLF